MILINKNVGETPLELINRLRSEQPEFATQTLSYAGRLDPMAEGEMLILVGDENNHREKFLGLDKEYIATFLVGVKTDTGDALGLIEASAKSGPLSREVLETELLKLKKLKTQKYPWFSGQTVGGIKLFDIFKSGKISDVERPTREISIKEIELLRIVEENDTDLKKYIYDSIDKVSGDFRQKEIVESWQKFFETKKVGGSGVTTQLFEISVLVSAGTYIRGLTEELNFPSTLLKLKRTNINLSSIEGRDSNLVDLR